MWPGASAALPAPRETGLHCWTPRGLLAPESRTLPDVLGDPGQVSRSPSARRTERHPGQRMELGPRPPHGTQAACPSARAPALAAVACLPVHFSGKESPEGGSP